MSISRKHKLAAGAAALATAAGAGGAVAATQDQNPRQAFLNDAAGRLHVTPQQLQSAMRGAFLDRLNSAVTAGQISQSQADRIRQRVERGGMPWLHPGLRRGGRRGLIKAAATYLGLSPQALRGHLRSGQTLAQVAAAQGKSVAGLEGAMTAAVKARLDRAVAAGRISSAREQQVLARLSARLDQLVNRQLGRSH